MLDHVPFSKSDIEKAGLSMELRNVLLLALSVQNQDPLVVKISDEENATFHIGEIPTTIEIGEQEYVADENETSVLYQDDPITNCAIHVRPDRTRWTKWATANGHDSITEELVYSGNKARDLQALIDFNDRITD